MRNIFSKFFLIGCAFASFLTAKGGIEQLRINEVLVKNETNYVDPYGVRCGWFEVFNTGYAMVDVGGCYVTNDMNNPTKYRIPKGNPKTKIAARAYALFFAYDKGDRGIFHINFSLDEKGFLAIFDQSGRILIDSVSYDISAQIPDHSFGKMENVKPIDSAKWIPNLDPTPEAANYTTVEKTRAEKYKETDPHGGIITLTTMTVVFTVLLSLALIFTYTGRYFKKKADADREKSNLLSKTGTYIKRTGRYIKNTVEDIPIIPHIGKEKEKVEEQVVQPSEQEENSLDMAAIATALYLHFDDQHEVEQTGFWLNQPLNYQTAWAAKSNSFKKSPIKKQK